jgi:hypothetical protein
MAVDGLRNLDGAQRRADELLEARLDADFGEGPLADYMAEALADALQTFSCDDGELDAAHAQEFFRRHELREFEAELERFVVTSGRGELVEELVEVLERDGEPEGFTAVLVGPIEAIGGVEPNGDSMVSCGFTTYVIRRGDWYSTFDTGDWDGLDVHVMDGRRAIADDPTLREVREGIVESSDPPGSGGVWLADESGFEEDLDREEEDLDREEDDEDGLDDEEWDD